MTITAIRPTLPLRLISLETGQTTQRVPLRPSDDMPTAGCLLSLVPGKRSELLILLENVSAEPIHWHFTIDGDVPSDWVSWHQSLAVIPPKSRVTQTVVLEPPSDFFERTHALSETSLLTLDYSASVSVYALIGSAEDGTDDDLSPTLAGYQPLRLQMSSGCRYLEFLPEIYRSDFMERFMGIIEQAFDPTVQTTNTLWAYLDPLTAPKSLLPFLAHWVDWPLNESWTLRQQRRLIKHAVSLYRWRGTKHSLRWMLHLHTGLSLDERDDLSEIDVSETHDSGFVLGRALLGANPRLGGGRPYFFSVTLRPQTIAAFEALDVDLLRCVIEKEKPAFCSYELAVVRPKS